jgi:chromosome segregation ATPase
LHDLEKTASTRIQAAESRHKSAEAGLMTAERQVKELTAKLDREINHSCELRAEISDLKAEVDEARAGVQKAEDTAQAYYDQGFEEAVDSLKSQLA